ncbi:MAG: hypothetical protein J7J42_01480 [Thermoplasmata archaeon]|nr:hypothetical protein [Thermoplasmata archaeon]
MAKQEKKHEDWFEKLQSELEKKKEEVLKDISTESEKKRELNRNLVEDFWKIWLQFNRINVHFRMEPPHNLWGLFEVFPDKWSLREDFDFATVGEISLVDITREQNRTGDSLKIIYYNTDEGEKIRMLFEFFEGEKYYKYSGWKRIYAQYILYDELVKKANLDKIRDILLKVIPKWYESHLKGDRGIIINYIKENYERGESFTL